VLDAAAQPPAARAAQAALRPGDESERGAQAAPARVGQRDHHRARLGWPVVGELDRLGVAGVDGQDGEVAVGVDARDARRLHAAVGERDRDLLVAKVVRVGEHLPGGDHDARPPPPAATEPDDRRPDSLDHVPDGR
jgi:hypothetical protein